MRAEWPDLPFDSWKDTYETLHRYVQIIGKIQLAQTPLVNHWWNAGLRITSRGLATQAFPIDDRRLEFEFDFVDHRLLARCSDGTMQAMPLEPRTVADFYAELLRFLGRIGFEPSISDKPCEIATDAIPFAQDTLHRSYDAEAAAKWWRILQLTTPIFEIFRGRFIGKSSPVIFWWGSFDLAVARFSGRRAPPRPGADLITREAYSHEVSSAGLWPGTAAIGGPAFYAYLAPAPPGYEEEKVEPAAAHWDSELGEFLLPYAAVREAPDPGEELLRFLQSTYDAGARLAYWDRARLERAAPASFTRQQEVGSEEQPGA